MTALPREDRPRHLHLVHSQDEAELEQPVYRPAWNWALALAIGACLGVWAIVVAGVVMLLLA